MDLFDALREARTEKLLSTFRSNTSDPTVQALAKQLVSKPQMSSFLDILSLKKPIEEVVGEELSWNTFFDILVIIHDTGQ